MNRACLLFGLLLLISGCSSPDPPPTFEIVSAKETDQLTFEFSDDAVRFDIQSETGIGNSEVKLESGQWPKTISLRLHKTGLESFKFSYPETVIEVSVPSGGEGRVLRSVMKIGKDIESAGEETAFFMPVEIDEDGKWIEVQVPADFYEHNPDGFRIDWIDFYR